MERYTRKAEGDRSLKGQEHRAIWGSPVEGSLAAATRETEPLLSQGSRRLIIVGGTL